MQSIVDWLFRLLARDEALLLFPQMDARHALEDSAELLQWLIGNRCDDAVSFEQRDLLTRPQEKLFRISLGNTI